MTFDAKGQGEYFLLCFALGYIYGIISGVILGEKLFKSSKLTGISKVIRACFFAIFFVFYKNYYNLPSLKAYFLIAYYLGFYIYLKTLAKIIAKIGENRGMGYCYLYWETKRDILKKDYGIEWRSPAVLNPRVHFD